MLPDLPPTYSQLDLASSPPSYSSPASYSSPPSYGPELEVCSYCIRGLHLCVPLLPLDAFLHPLHYLSDPPSLIHRHPIIQCLPWQIYKALLHLIADGSRGASSIIPERLGLRGSRAVHRWDQHKVGADEGQVRVKVIRGQELLIDETCFV